jgi:hypothetical protein
MLTHVAYIQYEPEFDEDDYGEEQDEAEFEPDSDDEGTDLAHALTAAARRTWRRRKPQVLPRRRV